MTDRKTILYAEDKEEFRTRYQRVMDHFFPGYRVVPFNDGTSLENRLAGNLNDVALIVTDNQMPGKTGFDIIKDHAREEKLRRIPVILLYNGEPIIGKVAVENGAFSYVSKMSDQQDLVAEMRRALDFSASTVL